MPLPPADSTTRHLTLFLRTRGDATEAAPGIRGLLPTAVPGLPYVSVRSLAEVLEPGYRELRLGSTLFGAYAGAALVLAALGLYSVLAYQVRGGRHELGIRLALGAEPGALVRLVVGDGVRLALLGVVLGVAAALLAGRTLASLLHGIAPWDPPTLGVATLVVLAAALAASLVPAGRAARVNPMSAIRSE